jgi:chromosome segregation ATPase
MENKLFTENNMLSTKIRELETTVHSKSRDLLDKQKKILDLEAAIVTYKTEQTNLNEVIKHRDDLTSKFNRIMEINYNLNEDISRLNSSYTEQLNILQDKITILQNANGNLKATIQQNENEMNQQKSTLNGKF